MSRVAVAGTIKGDIDIPSRAPPIPIGRRRVPQVIVSRIALKTEVESMINACAKGKIAKCKVIDVLSHHGHCLHDRH